MEQSGPHRGHGAIQHTQKRAFPRTVPQGSRQFQTASGDLIEHQAPFGSKGFEPSKVSETRLQCFLKIMNHRPGGDQTGLGIVEAEAGQSDGVELLMERLAGSSGIESPVGSGSYGSREKRAILLANLLKMRFGKQTFRRTEPGQLIGESFRRHIGGVKLAGGKLDPGQPINFSSRGVRRDRSSRCARSGAGVERGMGRRNSFPCCWRMTRAWRSRPTARRRPLTGRATATSCACWSPSATCAKPRGR